MGKMYVISEVGTNRYKIGVSESPMKRRGALQTGNSNYLEVIAVKTTEKAYKKEEKLHDDLIDRRVRGEWFELSWSEVEELTEGWEKFGMESDEVFCTDKLSSLIYTQNDIENAERKCSLCEDSAEFYIYNWGYLTSDEGFLCEAHNMLRGEAVEDHKARRIR